MSNISDFSEESISKRNPITIITDYKKQSYSMGVTRISYTETIHPTSHLVSVAWRWLVALSLAVDVAMRMGLGQHEYFFDNTTGKLLGSTRLESVKSAITIGTQNFNSGMYEDAFKYFNIAINLCKKALGNGNEQVELRIVQREAEMWKKTTRERIENLEKQRQQEKIQSILRELNHSWNEAFLAESKGNTDRASQLFTTCYKLSNEINKSTKDNKFQIWVDVTLLKLECNDFFNEAVNLQEEANINHDKQLYERALNKLDEARSKCKEALGKRHDHGFENCMRIIESNIEEIKHRQLSDQLTKIRVKNDANQVESSERVQLEHDTLFNCRVVDK